MTRHSSFTFLRPLVAGTLAAAWLATPAFAQLPDDTVALERPSATFEENFPSDATDVQAAEALDSWSEDSMSAGYFDTDADDAPVMFAALDSLETP
ncbi:MAG TPA: hypothetical protein VLW55_22310 [Burkholderiaceae bacterium]|nr:hypothetical protein [Burkholderiaceae bacterium]